MQQGDCVVISSGEDYHGEGISQGLARGLTAAWGGVNLTQEGMGLGAVACQRGGFTYFPRNARTEALPRGAIRKHFLLDSRITWQLFSWKSLLVTRVVEAGANAYMSLPRLQVPILSAATFFRTSFGARASFQACPPVASACIDYHARDGRVEMECALESRPPGLSKVFLMSELGADFFSSALGDGCEVPPPAGWNPLSSSFPTPAFYDPVRALRFTLLDFSVRPRIPFKVFWGREKVPDLCWAGFEIELSMRHASSNNFHASLSVGVEKAS
jgi:hypothetical protein